MEPWKERFITEYNELRDRILKLKMMLQKWENGKLDFEAQMSQEAARETA